MDFYKPDYLEDDFNNILVILGEDCTLNYNATTPTEISALITQLDFKSNMKGLSDSTADIKVSKDNTIKKGDYITDSTDNVYLINWNPFTDVNCYHAQIQLCTSMLTIEYYYEGVLDSSGVLVTEATPTAPFVGYNDIAADVYGFVQRIGTSTFDGKTATVGIEQSQRIAFIVQYNDDTADVEITHEFKYNNVQYMITDIDYAQLNPSGDDGIITLYAQVLEGGRHT